MLGGRECFSTEVFGFSPSTLYSVTFSHIGCLFIFCAPAPQLSALSSEMPPWSQNSILETGQVGDDSHPYGCLEGWGGYKGGTPSGSPGPLEGEELEWVLGPRASRTSASPIRRGHSPKAPREGEGVSQHEPLARRLCPAGTEAGVSSF